MKTPTGSKRHAGCMKTPTGSKRHAALRAWLDKHSARWHNEGKYGACTMEGYMINGRLVIVLHDLNGDGWDLLVPATTENRISATLHAAERACGIGGTVGDLLERIDQRVADQRCDTASAEGHV